MLLEKCKPSVWGNSTICFICSRLDPVVFTAEMKSITNGVPLRAVGFFPLQLTSQFLSSFKHSSCGHTEGTLQDPACIPGFTYFYLISYIGQKQDCQIQKLTGQHGWVKPTADIKPYSRSSWLPGWSFNRISWFTLKMKASCHGNSLLMGGRPLLQSEFFPEGQRGMQAKEAKLCEQWHLLTNIQTSPEKSVACLRRRPLGLVIKCQGSYFAMWEKCYFIDFLKSN